MPAPSHFRVTFSGIFGTVAAPFERWSHGLAIARGSVGGSNYTTALTTLATDLSGLWATHLSPRTVSPVRLTNVKVALVDADGRVGRTIDGQYDQGEWSGDKPGSASAPTMPPQVAAVVTLKSLGDGPTYRGRFFLPGPATGTMGSDMRLSAGTQLAIKDSAVSFINAVNSRTATQAADFGRVVIASAGSASRGIAPALRPVISVEVGKALDTMRSRRADLLEEYVSGAIA